MAMKKIQVRVPDPDHEILEASAKKLGISLSELVRRLLSKALREKHHEQI